MSILRRFALAAMIAALPAAAAGAQDALPPFNDGESAYHHHPLIRFVYFDPNLAEGQFPTFRGMVTPPKETGFEWVDGKKKHREIHTHEPYSGRLHTESGDPTRKYRLGDFMAAWKQKSPDVGDLVSQAKKEGVVYVFDFNATHGNFDATRLKDPADFLNVSLDDGRHIVVYLPKAEEKKAEMPAPAAGKKPAG